MVVMVMKAREADTPRTPATPVRRHNAEAFLELATMARSLFDTRAEFHDWFACMLHQSSNGAPKRSRGECDATSSLACAMTFPGDCAFATAGRQLDAVMRDLTTDQLEALLCICGDRQTA
jgi:hypothetical protein